MSGRQSSAVENALGLICDGMSPYAVAKIHRLSFSTIYRALIRPGELNERARERAGLTKLAWQAKRKSKV